MVPLAPNSIDLVVIHTTDSYYGDIATIDKWHKDRGWDMIGYHYLITNCYPTRYRWDTKRPDLSSDGAVLEGRPEEFRGAHVQGENWHSIGIALVGKHGQFSAAQLHSAINLCHELKDRFPKITEVKGHYEFTDMKTCPEIDMDLFRSWV